ncbi:chondroitinase-AC-like [Penaeus japonicus]|uniref:chondroitinase-AC-like n=1 Tax=Penaeus japonicus TaxID=27405 RepID=UPI001C70CC69|nr:chondroitinase-AC-like [Penaeus japonicus]
MFVKMAPLRLFGLLLLVSLAKAGWQTDLELIVDRMTEAALDNASYEDLERLLSLLKPDGSFSDLKYGQDDSESFRTHGRRQSAFMYHHINGKDLTAEILSCFSFITYDAPPNTDDNWWGHVIGVPSKMWEGVVLAKDLIGKELLTDFLDRYWTNTEAGPVWNLEDNPGSMAGGNLGPRAMLGEVEGLLRGTYFEVHAEVQEALFVDLAERQPYDGNGLRPDGCLHQHNIGGNHNTDLGYLDHTLYNLYNGSYGKELLRFVSMLMSWYTGTDLDFDDATIEGLYAAYLECQQWLFRGHTQEPTTCGRHITDGTSITLYATRGAVQDTGYNLQKLGRHLEEVEAVLHRYDNVLPDPEFALSGNKYFFNSDLIVHQRREYMASVRILSNRTTRPETWPPSQNGDGYFQGDGFMTVLVDGKEYGKPKKEVFLVYDWAKVPGVTNLYTTDIPQYRTGAYWSGHFFNDAKFVGGVSDGQVGVAAMVCRRPYMALRLLKTWFFFGDVIVALGSGISLPPSDGTGESVITTLAQLAFEGTYVIGTKNGGEVTADFGHHEEELPVFLHHRNVGYVFLNSDERLFTSADTRTHGEDNIDIFTAWLDHGSTPEDASHGYVVLPSFDLEQTRLFAANPHVKVLSQSHDLHVVCHESSKTLGAVFVKAGATGASSCGDSGKLSLLVDAPCLALVSVNNESADAAELSVSLADPQQMYDVIRIKVTFDGREAEHTVQMPPVPDQGSSVTVVIIV